MSVFLNAALEHIMWVLPNTFKHSFRVLYQQWVWTPI